MGLQVFPAPSGGSSYSSQPPASASSVLLDGQLVNSLSTSTSVTGTGAPWILYANGGGPTTITIAGTPYTIPAGSTVGTSAYTGSQSVTVTAPLNTTFTSSTMPSSGWYCVTYGNGYFVAVAPFTTANAYSTNGITWSASTLPSADFWYGITYGNGYFVAIATGTTAAAYSTNGTTWTASTMPSSAGWTAVTYGLVGATPTYVAVANGPTTAAASSTNGTTWTARTMPSSSNWSGVTYGNGYFVAIATGTTAGAYSTNGTTWTATTMPSSSNWYSTAYGLIGATNYYVAVAYNTTAGAYSTNGTSWTASTMPNNNWQSVTYGNGKFVAVAYGTTAGAYSTNGTTWTATTMPSNTAWQSVTYGLVSTTGYFVAVSQSGTTSAYNIFSSLPVAYGIYNGATVRA